RSVLVCISATVTRGVRLSGVDHDVRLVRLVWAHQIGSEDFGRTERSATNSGQPRAPNVRYDYLNPDVALNANPDIAVRCRELTKTYGTGASSVVALRGIDLDVHRGELLMVVGPSGCGKTTLISIIGTILDQDGGQCVVLDRDVEKMDETERALFRGNSIGFVFQLFNLLPALLDNVVVPLLISGASWAEGTTRARAALEAVGLGARLSATPAQLSVGQ